MTPWSRPGFGGMRFGFGLRDAEELFKSFFGGRDPFSDFFGSPFHETRDPFRFSSPIMPITDEFVRGGGRGYMQQQQSSF